jgi:hypothetical protein
VEQRSVRDVGDPVEKNVMIAQEVENKVVTTVSKKNIYKKK